MSVKIMALIEIDGQSLDIDIKSELQIFDWRNATWQSDKLIASSPFRDDNAPSFWVNLEGDYAGVFGDSGFEDKYYATGTLPKLLAYLYNFSYEEAVEYLLDKYSDTDGDKIMLRAFAKLRVNTTQVVGFAEEVYRKPIDTEYLRSRGIKQSVVKFNEVFDNGNSIGIVWRSLDGTVSAIKYRNKKYKTFWYERGGRPLSKLVYGLYGAVQRGITEVVVCEAEIDAMTWQSAGKYAVAIGGARFNEYQRELMLSAGITKIVLAGDNDRAGGNFNKQVYKLLKDYVEVDIIDYKEFGDSKDANDLGYEKLRNIKHIPVKENIKI